MSAKTSRHGQQANHTVILLDEKETAVECEKLMKEIEFEEIQVKVLKGIVIRQMTTGVWKPDSQKNIVNDLFKEMK
jgi:hypothetical protein